MTNRAPLTGVVRIEWVDAADPNDASAEPNFGWFGVASEPPLDDHRLVLLLREVLQSLDRDLENGV